MKKFHLIILILICNILSIYAIDFNYEGLEYTVLDSNAKTCETKQGKMNASSVTSCGNPYSGDLVIPETVYYGSDEYTVVQIGKGSFYNTDVTTIDIPKTVENINQEAFSWCYKLTEVKIASKNINIDSFHGCNKLNKVWLSDEVSNIGYSAFNSCTALRDVRLPQNNVFIDQQAFYNCTELKNIENTSYIKEISTQSFGQCSSLVNLDLSGIERINAFSFKGCSSLESITFGEKCTYIGQNAFNGCNNIRKVVSLNTTPPEIGSLTFTEDTKKFGTLTIPFSTKWLYVTADYWKEFINIIELEKQEDSSSGYYFPENEINAVLYLDINEEKDISDLIINLDASTIQSTNEESVTINQEKIIKANNYGRTYILVKNANDDYEAIFEVFVCPILAIEHGDGIIYNHHVIYNSIPKICLTDGKGYKLAGVTHDGVPILDQLISNEGYYTSIKPITDYSVINISLEPNDENVTTGNSSVITDTNYRFYVNGKHLSIDGEIIGGVIITDLNGNIIFNEYCEYEFDFENSGVYLIKMDDYPNAFKILIP